MRNIYINPLTAEALEKYPVESRDLVLRISPAGCEAVVNCDNSPSEILGCTYNYSIIEEAEAWGFEEFLFFNKAVLQPMRNVYLLLDSSFESLFPPTISMYRCSAMLRQMWSTDENPYNKDEIWNDIDVNGFPRAGVLISSSLLKFLNRTFQTFNLEWAPTKLVKEWHVSVLSSSHRKAVNVFVAGNDITTDVAYFDRDGNLLAAVTYSYDNTLENIAFYVVSSIKLLTHENPDNSLIHLDGKQQRVKELNDLFQTEKIEVAPLQFDDYSPVESIAISQATMSFVKTLKNRALHNNI